MTGDLSDGSMPYFETQVFQLPNEAVLVNYFKTRQLMCHYNNLHATAFWKLVYEKNLSKADAHEMLKVIYGSYFGLDFFTNCEFQGKTESDLNEILFNEFYVNYNNEPDIYRKGTLIYKVTKKH